MDLFAAHCDGPRDGARDVAGERHHSRLVVGIVQAQQEFVAAKPRDDVAVSRPVRAAGVATSIRTSSPPSCPSVSLMSWKPSRSIRISAAMRGTFARAAISSLIRPAARQRLGRRVRRIVAQQKIDACLGLAAGREVGADQHRSASAEIVPPDFDGASVLAAKLRRYADVLRNRERKTQVIGGNHGARFAADTNAVLDIGKYRR